MPALRALLLDRRFSRDLLWNYAALGFLAVGGILTNLLIAGHYGAAALGVFNQVYAVYVLISQLAAGGIQYSALRHVAEHSADGVRRSQAGWSAVVTVLLLAAPWAILICVLGERIGALVDSTPVGQAMSLAGPGLVFFALNKVLLGILNGLRCMREFAAGQALRYLVMISWVLVAMALDLPAYWLGATFTVSEVILSLILVPLVARRLPAVRQALDPAWWKRHAVFGFRGFMSGVLLETNARVDVFMLGLFLSDWAVGIYSFAAMLAEGLYNLLGVVRNNVNPLLVQLLRDGRIDELRAMVRTVQRWVYPAAGGLALLVLGLYRPVVHLLLGGGDFLESWSVLAILVAGILFCSGYVPFDFILLQAGQPGYHTLLTGMNFGSNVLFNALLVPRFGIHGAAAGTALALGLSVFYLCWTVRRRLSFRLGTPLG